MGQWRAATILVLFLLLTVTTSACNIWVTRWSADWKNDPEHADLNTHFRLGIHVALGALHLTLTLLGLIFMAHSSLTSACNLHRDLLSRVLRATLTFFDTTPGGRIVNWFTKDTDDIDISIPKEIWFQLYSLPPILSMIAITTYVLPATLLLNIPMLASFVAIQRLYTTYVCQVMRIDGVTKSPVFSFFNETVRGAVSIRAYRKQKHFCDIFYNLVDDSTRPMWHLAAAKVLMITVISYISTAMCMCVSVVCVVYRNQLDPALSAVALFCTMQGMFTLQSFVRHTAELERSLVAVERVTGHNHLTKEGAWSTPDGACVDNNWPLGGSIRFEAYSTTYRADLEPALRDLTFTIRTSEKVGIVGRTGAGKTTLTLALLRMLEPQNGHIYIDNVDIAKLGLHHLRSNVTVITQDPVLFEGTIRDNLDPAGCHDDAALWEALEHAHLKDFIMAAPGGLNWYCRDAGQLLSVGQCQLVCLARALLRRSRVMVLDEPTASVDVTTDRLVQETLKQHLNHCTLITIAHRLHTIIDYDRVLVIEAGRVAEFDTPHKLLQDTSSHFYSLAREAGLVC